MKHGFALIELIVATLVASMVAAILLAALSQGNKFQMVVDNTIDTSIRIGVVSHQLEKDFLGAFIPAQSEVKEEKKNEKKAVAGKQPFADKKDEAEQKGSEQKEEKPIEKIFFSTNKGGNLETLTFITNNPMDVFVGKDVGVVKPKVVRVQYTLKPEAGKKDSYALFRQESMELNLEKYKDVRAYEVIGGIKNCTMTFTARIQKKDDNKKAAQSKEKPKVEYEYKVLNEWVSEQKKDADKEKAEFPRIPYSIEMKIALWNMQDTREKDFIIACQLPVDFTPIKEDKKQQEQPPKEEEQPDKSADKNNVQVNVIAQNKPSVSSEAVAYNNPEVFSSKLDNLRKMFGNV